MDVPTGRYVAVIFTSQRTGVDEEGYAAAAVRMDELAAQQAGFLGVESVHAADGAGITVSYWATDADARSWKQHSEHLLAQHAGRERWYQSYTLRVATVEREYSYDRGSELILHMALPDDWAAAQRAGEYLMSTRGRSLDEEGFIHCSYPDQLVGVANRFYADVSELVLLHVDPTGLDVRVEPAVHGGTELFPHVYGPIPLTAVMATTRWERAESGWATPPVASR